MVELLTTLVVLAVLLAIAAPGMTKFVNNSRLRASHGELVSALGLARSEATKRGLPVAVKAKGTTVGAEFSDGWDVFQDTNGNDQLDAGEPVIRSYSALSGNQRFGTLGGEVVAVFTNRGFLKTAAAVRFKLCGQVGEPRGYSILLEPVGMADVVEDDRLCA
jgi:type IV fimbrial biogenesis protein FimT